MKGRVKIGLKYHFIEPALKTYFAVFVFTFVFEFKF